jgi:hypothetical protein
VWRFNQKAEFTTLFFLLRKFGFFLCNSVFVYINSIYVDKNPVSVDENKSLSQQTKKAGFTTSLLFDGRNVRKDICRIGASACFLG